MVKSCETRMPTTRAMSGSSTPARIMAPSRVRSSSSQSATREDHGDDDDGEPVERKHRRRRPARSRRGRRRLDVDRIAAPHHQAEIGGHERQAERDQHLRQRLARQLPQQQALDQRAEEPRPAAWRGPPPARNSICTPSTADDEGRAEIGAQHEQRAVRQIRNAHQPEDQRKARRQQKQQSAEGDAVDRQHQPEVHGRRGSRACHVHRGRGRLSRRPRC